MKIIECKDQSSETLEEYYSSITNMPEIGQAMLSLIQRLREQEKDVVVYALTSHFRLCLLSEDSFDTPWYVILSVLDFNNYTIEYLMHKTVSPWPYAYVKGEAHSEEKALEMVLKAIEESKGWKA